MQLTVVSVGLVVAAAVAVARPSRAADALAQQEAEAKSPAALPAAELELRLGLGRRSDALAVRDVRADAEGGALSDLALAAAWFGRSAHVGLAAHFALERFALRGSEGASEPERVNVTGLAGSAGLALRGGAGSWLRVQAEIGYGVVRLPVVFVAAAAGGPARIAGGALGAHGPVARAGLRYALGDWIGVELGGEALPIGFGARYDGLPVTTRCLGGRAGLAITLADTGGARWMAVAGYDLSRATAEGRGGSDLSVRQVSHHVGLGVRAAWLAGAEAPVVAPPPPGRLRVIVRERAPGAASGPRLAGIAVAAAGNRATTDARGEVVLERLGTAPVELRLTGAGFAPGREVVAAPAAGEAAVEILLDRSGEATSAAITGLVRAESGMPVPARVGVLELGLEQVADAEGAFRFVVPPGRYTLTIAAEGYIAQRKVIRTGADEQRIFNVDLQVEPK